ncbi:MAG: phytanoyl-CoA dioxygenase family protein [Acidimicrobiales bacterium]
MSDLLAGEPPALSPAAVTTYVNDGYLVVPDVLDATEVEELRAEIVGFARGKYPVANAGPNVETTATDEEALRSLLAVHFPHWVSPTVERYVRHAQVAAILSQITGAHLPHWDGSVKCMQSMMFVKSPGLPGQAWHQDERFIPTRDRSLVGAWIALDDATVANGCLWVLPGSHRNGYLWPTEAHGDDEFDLADRAHGFVADGAVAVEVAAGAVVFFNGYLLHHSYKNRSDGYRRALVNHYCNAWSLLPWIPGASIDGGQVGVFDNRNVVHVAGEDPYGWKGYDEPPKRVFLRPVEPESGSPET